MLKGKVALVTGAGTLKQIVCRMFIISDSKQKLRERIDAIHNTLKVYDDNGENMLIGLFDTSVIDKLY